MALELLRTSRGLYKHDDSLYSMAPGTPGEATDHQHGLTFMAADIDAVPPSFYVYARNDRRHREVTLRVAPEYRTSGPGATRTQVEVRLTGVQFPEDIRQWDERHAGLLSQAAELAIHAHDITEEQAVNNGAQ